jgi:P27 family predicted phage terminase small subunit
MARARKPVQMKVKKTQGRGPRTRLVLPTGIPYPGLDLTPAEKKHYNKMAKMFYEKDIIKHLDAYILSMMAKTAHELEVLETEINGEYTYKSTGGRNGDQIKANPLLNQYNLAMQRMRQLMGECGMTPAARMKIESTEGKQMDIFESAPMAVMK